MNYSEIKARDIANGSGVRVSLFVSGCTHHCRGCFNPETWDFSAGKLFDSECENSILKMLEPSYIRGLSLLGGEPMEPVNQDVLLPFVKKVKERYPDKDIWCYTGYTLDTDLKVNGKAFCSSTTELLGLIDVLVDGEFEEDKKNLRLPFRGSENQRIIDMKKTAESDRIILLDMTDSRM